MIEIFLSPCCTDCQDAELVLHSTRYTDGAQSSTLQCAHQHVCKRALEDVRRLQLTTIYPNEPTKDEWFSVIETLSDIRAGFNVFKNSQYEKYHACAKAIRAIRELIGAAEIYDVERGDEE